MIMLPQHTRIFCLIMYLGNVSCLEFEIRDNDKNCNLATPDITFTRDGNYIKLPSQLNAAIKQHERIQVGYVQTKGVFRYIGCAESGHWYYIPKHEVKSEPGQCYSLCRTPIFGLHDRACICLPTNLTSINIKSAQCRQKCSDNSNTACGGETNGTRFVSLYKYVTSLSTHDNGYNCRALNFQSQSFEWLYCGTKMKGICRKAGKSRFSTKKSNWKDYTVQCFESKGLPDYDSDYNERTAIDKRSGNTTDFLWIGSIKSDIIESIYTGTNYSDLKGVITMDKDTPTYILTFESSQDLNGSKQLCLKVLAKPAITRPGQQQSSKGLIFVYSFIPLCLFGVIGLFVIHIVRQLRQRFGDDEIKNTKERSSRRVNEHGGLQNRAYECAFDPRVRPKIKPFNRYNSGNRSRSGCYLAELSQKLERRPLANNAKEYIQEASKTPYSISHSSEALMPSITQHDDNDSIYHELDDDKIRNHDQTNEHSILEQTGSTVNVYGHLMKCVTNNTLGVAENVYDKSSDREANNKSRFVINDNTYSHAVKKEDRTEDHVILDDSNGVSMI